MHELNHVQNVPPGCDKRNISSRQILVIDQDHEHVQWLREYFNLNGYSVTIMRNGREGMNALRTHTIFGILMSIDGTDESQQKLMNEVRRNYPDVPVFVMSKALDSHMAGKCLAEGIHGFLPKPLLYDKLQEVLFALHRREVVL